MYTIITVAVFWFFGILFSVFAQTFTRITDQSNPVVTDSFPGGYPGAAWIDFNNDNLLDLFANNDYLYENIGDGNFIKNTSFKGMTQPIMQPTIASGSSWADYNNDGYIDMFSASSKSFLFRNNGNESFTRISDGVIGDSLSNRGWGCAWADYDNDGNVDLLIFHPANFVPGTPLPNLLFHNEGPPDYNFTQVSGFHFTTQLAPYTVATWSDYDLDGDVDLFIASGPASSNLAADYLYKNMLKENGTVSFERITQSPIGTELQNGQTWNWVDFDNDGDMDGFLTNYSFAPNRFYRNDNGTYTSITTGMELSNIACLANSWGDFDNDGYLDVVITSETKNYFFHNNNGDGSFTMANNAATANGNGRGATIGDYDNDGDLDLFVIGFPPARGLFRNNNDNGNNWKKFRLTGINSNKSAIGAVVRIKAVIDGTSLWQIRQVAAQNSFNSMNSLIVHFGLRDASVIDSVIINWPSGKTQILTDVPVNSFEEIEETGSTDINENGSIVSSFRLEQNYPNPFNPSTTIKYSIPGQSFVTLKLYNLLGELEKTLVNEFQNSGEYKINLNADELSSGVYFYVLQSGDFLSSKKMILMK